jgi:Bacterial Ig-like domain (group 2)
MSLSRRYPRRPLRLVALVLLLAAREDGCNFSLGPDGLCAAFRVNPERTRMRVGESFRIAINADGCTAATGCACEATARADAVWRSENPVTAIVDSTGLVLARSPGATTIQMMPAGGSWSRTRVQVTVIP